MLEHRNFRAWITCGDEKVETYQPEIAERQMTGWIASAVGKEFQIRVQDMTESRFCTFSARVYIDGSQVFYEHSGAKAVLNLTRMRTSPTTEAPMLFSPLRTTDDECVAKPDDATLKDFGTIKIVVARVTVRSRNSGGSAHHPALREKTIHERSKKAALGGLQVKTGQEIKTTPQSTVQVVPYDPTDPGPHVTFEFRYRSQQFLEAQGIIVKEEEAPKRAREEKEEPRAPAKRARNADAENDDDEIAALQARIAELQGRRGGNVKREGSPRVKREKLPLVPRRGNKPEVIDLT